MNDSEIPLLLGLAEILICFFGAAFVAAGLARLLITAGRRAGLVAVPNERSLHDHPVPHTGGLAILASILVGAPVAAVGYGTVPPAGWTAIAAGALLVAGVSLVDDWRGLSPLIRLAVHLAAAVLLAGAGFLLPLDRVISPSQTSTVLTVLATVVGVVWMTNLYNFMDGMDGFAGGMTVFGFGFLAAFGVLGNEPFYAAVMAVISGGALGFLAWNFPPARIFMGDTGAATLGFLAAASALWGVRDGLFPFWVPVLVFSPFIVDSSVVLLRRLLRGERVWQAHRSHYYQRLVQAGWGHRKTVLVEYVLMLLAGLSALIFRDLDPAGLVLLLVAWASLYAGAITLVHRIEIPVQFANRNFWIVLATDVLLLVAAHLLAYAIRFDGHLTALEWGYIRTFLPGLILLKIAVFSACDLYRGMWRYTGLTDLLHIVKACLISFLVATVILLIFFRFEGLSRSVFILDAILAFLFIAGHRIALRLYYQQGNRFLFAVGRRELTGNRRGLLVIGAGDAAEKVLREINDNPTLPYVVLGLLDDHPDKIGKRIHGVLVMAPIDDLPEVAAKTKADEILIAIPSANREQMNRIVELCRAAGVPFKTLPGLGEIIDGRVSIRASREVSYKDLLGRQPVRLELERIGDVVGGRTVLVTGAGGSIGSELCRQILRFRPAKLVLFDAGEENLYRIEMEILHERGWSEYVPVLGKIQNRSLVEHVFASYAPSVVLHAAAYKHVPLVEGNPWEAVFNNVVGTRILLDAALRHQVERFLLVSTDKAVRPTNVMGASKRVAERLMLATWREARAAGAPTKFMAVRFGNVLGSSGSVVPLFRRQIELGGPVTVTHPEVTRYFMSIEEAAQLILQAVSMGEGGEIFVLKMGTPVRIADMARDLIRLCGKEPESEIAIKYIGLRPGEKLYEELITEGEDIVSTTHEEIMVLRGDGDDFGALAPHLEELVRAAEQQDAGAIRRILAVLVPEYRPAAGGGG